jgi:hypothetical protein
MFSVIGSAPSLECVVVFGRGGSGVQFEVLRTSRFNLAHIGRIPMSVKQLSEIFGVNDPSEPTAPKFDSESTRNLTHHFIFEGHNPVVRDTD